MKRKLISIALAFALVLGTGALFASCGQDEELAPITLATTTSTQDSGLLDYLLPVFEDETGYTVEVVAVGSGEALALGEQGEADVLLVHSPADEETFVANGNADDAGRVLIMYNDFVIIGPTDDPAGVADAAGTDAALAFETIADDQATFISRADDSGTYKKELAIWTEADMTPSGDWYVEAAAGMGDVIAMANEKLGYTLSDRATWLNLADTTDLMIVSEKDPSGILFNQYSCICVNPDKNENINADGAKAFQEWLVSADTQELINQYGVEDYGQQLFVANAE